MKKLKIIIIAWFIFSWLCLIVFTLKPTGTLNILMRGVAYIKDSLYPPVEYVLGDFSSAKALEQWAAVGMLAEIAERGMRPNEESVKITLLKSSQGAAKLVLEDYNLGAGGRKDWRRFSFLKLSFFNPQPAPILFHIKIKDMGGRYIEIPCQMKTGEDTFSINLAEIGETVDLANVIHLSMYYTLSPQENVFYVDKVWLVRESPENTAMADAAPLNLIAVNIPALAKRGTSIAVSLQFSLLRKVRNDYTVFIHFSYAKEAGKKPADRRWYVNADQLPALPTSQWAIDKAYEAGPVSFYIPKEFPAGTYVLQAGLFNPLSHGSYGKGSCAGKMDFSGSYPRLRYAHPSLKNYIVGKIKVLE